MHNYRLYIGANNTTGKVEKAKLFQTINKYFKGFSYFEGFGSWEGRTERNIYIEITTNKEGQVRQLINELLEVLEQQSIGLAKEKAIDFISNNNE